MALYVKSSHDVTAMQEYKQMFYLSGEYSFYKLFPFIIHQVTINVLGKQ